MPNGITIFPGGFPLYRNGQLIGAIGISGDGVDQDDIVGASGTSNFLPPDPIRADQFNFLGTRLPYGKFPRDPEGFSIQPAALPVVAALALPLNEMGNISTRVDVKNGDGLMISGFIVRGDSLKTVVIRGLGPSLGAAGVPNALADPVLRLFDESGTLIAQNDNWRDGQRDELSSAGIAPSDAAESALLRTLPPGSYTASVTGQGGATGVGLLEVYDIDPLSPACLLNISTRGTVGREDEVMIGGFIMRGSGGLRRVMVRALGPSLASHGVPGALSDPTLEIRDSNGAILAANNNWRETQETEILASTIAPENDSESAVILSLQPGPYTAILHGADGGVGVGLLEAYRLE